MSTVSMSPSPRRAWIEITGHMVLRGWAYRSPSPRRAWIEITAEVTKIKHGKCRPPHGGRGLKYGYFHAVRLRFCVALPTEGVD